MNLFEFLLALNFWQWVGCIVLTAVAIGAATGCFEAWRSK
jgi:hypothetical protein